MTADPRRSDQEADLAVCPWCGGQDDVERLSTFGPMHMTEQWFCGACRSPFERVRLRGARGGGGD